MNHSARTALRWVGVLPVAALAYFATYFLINLMAGLGAWLWGKSAIAQYILPAVATGAAANVAIIVGALVAPNYKKYTALTLLVLLAMGVGISLLMLSANFQWVMLSEVIGHLIGGFIGFANVDEAEQKEALG